jgi:glucose/mannose-6-phosphate isomerase
MLDQMDKSDLRFNFPADADQTCDLSNGSIQNVVVAGLGGSGIVGEIVLDSFRDSLDIPLAVCRSTRTPKYVNSQTLFIAISYSGQTTETLELTHEASVKGARVVAISSGGALLAECMDQSIPYLKVPKGLAPRVALPELVSAAIYVLHRSSLLDGASDRITETSMVLKGLTQNLRPKSPLNVNKAKQIAVKLQDRLPILIGSEENVSAMRRFKNQLNENSKVPAFFYSLPEGYHDDVEGLRTLRGLVDVQPIVLEVDESSSSPQTRARGRLIALFDELGFQPSISVLGEGVGRLARLLSVITVGDYASVYLSILRGLDPTDLTVIPIFRTIMRPITNLG